MRHRVRLNASRKNGLVSTVSARALNVAIFTSFSDLPHQRGTRPHRIGTSSRLLRASLEIATARHASRLYDKRLRASRFAADANGASEPWARTPPLNGPITPSIHGGAAPWAHYGRFIGLCG